MALRWMWCDDMIEGKKKKMICRIKLFLILFISWYRHFLRAKQTQWMFITKNIWNKNIKKIMEMIISKQLWDTFEEIIKQDIKERVDCCCNDDLNIGSCYRRDFYFVDCPFIITLNTLLLVGASCERLWVSNYIQHPRKSISLLSVCKSNMTSSDLLSLCPVRLIHFHVQPITWSKTDVFRLFISVSGHRFVVIGSFQWLNCKFSGHFWTICVISQASPALHIVWLTRSQMGLPHFQTAEWLTVCTSV